MDMVRFGGPLQYPSPGRAALPLVYARRNGICVEHGPSVFDPGLGGVSDGRLGLENAAAYSVRVISSSWRIPWRHCRMVSGVLEPLSVA